MEFVYGALSGFAQNIVGFPLDTIKVLKQNNMQYSYKNIFHYYHGFEYAMMSQTIINAVSFALVDYFYHFFPNPNMYIAGGLTGIVVSPIVFILDVGKIKKQISNKSIKITMSDFVCTRGKGTTVFREGLALGIYFGSYNQLREYKINSFLAGGASGVFNWGLTYPLDIIKTRQMTYYIDFKTAFKMGNLTKGLGICLTRAWIVNAVGFTSYEISKKWFTE